MPVPAAWASVFLLASSIVTQGLQHDWNRVKALTADAIVRIEQVGGRQLEGRLVSATDTEVAILVGVATVVVDRQSIRQVDQVVRPVGKRALLGLLIGGAGGAILGHSTAESNKGAWTALMAAGWAAIGAVIGVVDGLKTRDYRLVYQSPSSEILRSSRIFATCPSVSANVPSVFTT